MTHPTTYLKYLPVEGEIKEMDRLVTDNGKGVNMRRYAVTTDIEVLDQIINTATYKKSYVISRHHKLLQGGGNEFVGYLIADSLDGGGITGEISKFQAFKVLEPISPQVTWDIQDGAEIEGMIENGSGDMNGNFLKAKIGTFKVKGPCGHYH